jgi:solute carrier family 30 (zinc transporter), member 5/7
VDLIKVTWKDPNSRNILIFFTINLMFMFVELLYGYLSGSLGLISDAFHMLFDCAALLIGLIASYISQLKDIDKLYTYGYGRIETISGLFNGVFLIFISYNIFCESVERIFEPVKIQDESLITVSVLGLLVNMVGLVFFHDFHHHGEGGCSHGHAHASQDHSSHDHSSHSHSHEPK